MSDKTKGGVRWGARFVSFLLVAGGILGIISSVFLATGFIREHRPYRVSVPLVSIGVFAWGAFKGIDLWRGKARGYKCRHHPIEGWQFSIDERKSKVMREAQGIQLWTFDFGLTC